MLKMRNIMENEVYVNIENAQARQRTAYSKRHQTEHVFKVNDKVLLRNLRRDNRKGGWSSLPWKPKVGCYVIYTTIYYQTCVLKYKGKILKTRQHIKNLKYYHEQENVTTNDVQMFENNEMKNEVLKYFNPVSYLWQKIQCRYFNLTIKHINQFPSISKCLMKPLTTISTIGDGNCFYRSLSWWITGDEDSHHIIRQELNEVNGDHINITVVISTLKHAFFLSLCKVMIELLNFVVVQLKWNNI